MSLLMYLRTIWRKQLTRGDLGYLWPLVSTAIVVTSFLILYPATVRCKWNVQCLQPNFAPEFRALRELWPPQNLNGIPQWQFSQAAAYQGHIAWALVTSLYVLVCLAAVVVGSYVIYRAVVGERREK